MMTEEKLKVYIDGQKAIIYSHDLVEYDWNNLNPLVDMLFDIFGKFYLEITRNGELYLNGAVRIENQIFYPLIDQAVNAILRQEMVERDSRESNQIENEED